MFACLFIVIKENIYIYIQLFKASYKVISHFLLIFSHFLSLLSYSYSLSNFLLSEPDLHHLRRAILLAHWTLLLMIGPPDFSHIFFSRLRHKMPTTEEFDPIIGRQHLLGHGTHKDRVIQMPVINRYLEGQYHTMRHVIVSIIILAVPAVGEELLAVFL